MNNLRLLNGWIVLVFVLSIVLVGSLVSCDSGGESGTKMYDDEEGKFMGTGRLVESDPMKRLPEIDPDKLEREAGVLTYAPEVPPPINRREPALVVYELETTEVDGELADGVGYTFWTFKDTVPGPMMRVREGDLVEFTLVNNSKSKMPHNIDLHAVTGPGGGAEATYVVPGERKTFRFRALQAGVYVYHCAVPPVGMHVANGMYGMIVVDPQEGWSRVDREYQVVQSEFYTVGDFGQKGHQQFSMERALAENPAYVLFNGRVGALQGENALKAEVGETVRLFVGNAGPNLISSFHVIGEIFDTVYLEGGTLKNHNVQTTQIAAGGTAVMEMSLQVPGDYLLVDHAIFRAFNKGALGILQVSGPENPLVHEAGVVDARSYAPSPGPRGGQDQADDKDMTLAQRVQRGDVEYRQQCASCHGETGKGIAKLFPPLIESAHLANDKDAITGVLKGREGDWGVMPAFGHLPDATIAQILTFVRQAFGNDYPPIETAEVTKVREELEEGEE